MNVQTSIVIDRLTAGAGVTHALNALTSAGSFTLDAGSYVIISRRNPAPTGTTATTETLKVTRKEIESGQA